MEEVREWRKKEERKRERIDGWGRRKEREKEKEYNTSVSDPEDLNLLVRPLYLFPLLRG